MRAVTPEQEQVLTIDTNSPPTSTPCAKNTPDSSNPIALSPPKPWPRNRGLGKTLQTLAFLRFIRQTQPGVAPMLIVCPTSLVFNWVAEARKFTPELKVLALHGPDRHTRFEQIQAHDIVVTSYVLMRRDAERYRELEFDTVALDEAQHIKNRQTQNAQAVKAVWARQRIALTGTPLENSRDELQAHYARHGGGEDPDLAEPQARDHPGDHWRRRGFRRRAELGGNQGTAGLS